MTTILAFGDSIVQGFWDKEGGWVQRLRKHLDRISINSPSDYFSVFNLGVSGDTSKDLLARFEFETKNRLNDGEGKSNTIIIFSVGTNDSIFNNKTKLHRISQEEYRKNLTSLFGLAKKYASTVIFLGDTPVDEEIVDPIPWVKDCSYRNEFIEDYQKIAKDVCKEQKIHFLEIYKNFVNKDYKNLLEDGCHPNSDGHEEIYSVVKTFLVNNNLIP